MAKKNAPFECYSVDELIEIEMELVPVVDAQATDASVPILEIGRTPTNGNSKAARSKARKKKPTRRRKA
jgi:hypothetical protein